MNKPLIAGVGMVPFRKPGKSDSWDQMGAAAARTALQDASVPYEDIEVAHVGYVYADSTAARSALYNVGLTGIPIINVNNNCSSGSTALYLACQAIAAGTADVALALGFEQMIPGKLGLVFEDRKRTLDRLTTALFGMLTRYQACAPTCGAAAAVVVWSEYAKRHSLKGVVQVAGQAMTTDTSATFENLIGLVGADMTRQAVRKVYQQAGAGPEDELHDCFTTAEVVFSEALGLCPEGGFAKYAADGDNTYGGKHVVNPSGGLLAKGHPLGATGLAQTYELVRQLRGTAELRQVPKVRNALAHNTGLGGATIVTMLRT